MISECDKRRMAYEAGEIGMSVRRLRVADLEVADVHRALLAARFHHSRVALAAERAADGAARWRLRNGTATKDRAASDLLPVESYAHVDGGWVVVFPEGDPRGRIVPRATPSAIKSVLFNGPRWRTDETTSARVLDVVTYFDNVAFRVTDEGEAIPKTRRAAYGLRYDAKDLAGSYRFAQTIAKSGILPLRRSEAK